MTKKHKAERWIGKCSNSQGLIYRESNGKNVAVVYDVKDMPLIAAAPELRDAGKAVIGAWEQGDLAAAVRQLAAVINDIREGA